MISMISRRTALSLACAALLTGCNSLASIEGSAYRGPTSLAGFRTTNGLSVLNSDPALEAAALEQARFMANAGNMSHTTGSGGTFSQRMRSKPTNGGAAENIAYGAFGTDELFRRWMESPPHRRNMLNPSFTRYGLASAADPKGGKRRYWALVLAR